mmetsp:Transcript_32852/g.71694  ORF Transcript_32852/g.71694 Transcript_32852/m.71694 type:complete len:210 (+) Transcript_32852:283-912(+)
MQCLRPFTLLLLLPHLLHQEVVRLHLLISPLCLFPRLQLLSTSLGLLPVMQVGGLAAESFRALFHPRLLGQLVLQLQLTELGGALLQGLHELGLLLHLLLSHLLSESHALLALLLPLDPLLLQTLQTLLLPELRLLSLLLHMDLPLPRGLRALTLQLTRGFGSEPLTSGELVLPILLLPTPGESHLLIDVLLDAHRLLLRLYSLLGLLL